MPDDAIERARECLARTMEEFGGHARLSCAADIRRDVGNEYWDVPVRAMLAFASQQAPEGWVLVPREPTTEMLSAAFTPWMHDSEQEVMCENIWSAMLDAAPSVTLGEVG